MDLFEQALALDPESDERWELVRSIQHRGDEATFRAASAWCGHADPARRKLAVDVLAQLGDGERRPFREPTVELLLALAEHEADTGVLDSIGAAFGHLRDPRAIDTLCRLAVHPDEEVRFSATFGLLGHEDQRAIDALVALTADEDSDVRDWATFGLAENGVDTEQVREALAARLDDPDGDTREEAISGLARRGDERAVEPLLELLKEWEGMILDESLLYLAARTGDPRLRAAFEERLPELQGYSDPGDGAPSLEAAAAALGLAPRSG